MTFRLGIAVMTYVFLGSACSYQLSSPPARMVHLESARTLAPGEMSAALKGTAQAALFEPAVAAGTAVVRRGLTESLEVSGEATYAILLPDYEEDAPLNIDPNIYAGRVGMKLAKGRHVALTAGLGGGYAPAAGGFAATDVGGIVSYDNCYVVPFGSLSAFLSQPVGAKTVDFGSHGTSQASTSYGFSAAAGFEVPLAHQRCREGRATPKLALGANTNYIRNTSSQVTAQDGSIVQSNGGDYLSLGLAAGVEIPF
jgi:hypothetical protein